MTNVIAAEIESDVLVFVTDISFKVLEAKVRTESDQLIDLVPYATSKATNAFSLKNLPAGVYTLGVITQKGNTQAEYEGILVISQRTSTIIDGTTRQVINREINEDRDVTVILPPDNEPPTSPQPTPPPASPQPTPPSDEPPSQVENGDNGDNGN